MIEGLARLDEIDITEGSPGSVIQATTHVQATAILFS
jgi:hypothetical protein